MGIETSVKPPSVLRHLESRWEKKKWETATWMIEEITDVSVLASCRLGLEPPRVKTLSLRSISVAYEPRG